MDISLTFDPRVNSASVDFTLQLLRDFCSDKRLPCTITKLCDTSQSHTNTPQICIQVADSTSWILKLEEHLRGSGHFLLLMKSEGFVYHFSENVPTATALAS